MSGLVPSSEEIGRALALLFHSFSVSIDQNQEIHEWTGHLHGSSNEPLIGPPMSSMMDP